MARPQKNNADYFSHDANMRNDPKIKALRTKFGLQGYAVWCMMLEILTNCENFQANWDEIAQEIYAGDIGISTEEMQSIVSFCDRIGLFSTEIPHKIECKNLSARMRPLTEKREFLRQKYNEKRVSTAETTQKPEFQSVKTPHSKVKQSKVKNISNDIFLPEAKTHTRQTDSFNLEETIATMQISCPLIPRDFICKAWEHYEAKGWLLTEGVHIVKPMTQIKRAWEDSGKRAYILGNSTPTNGHGTTNNQQHTEPTRPRVRYAI